MIHRGMIVRKDITIISSFMGTKMTHMLIQNLTSSYFASRLVGFLLRFNDCVWWHRYLWWLHLVCWWYSHHLLLLLLMMLLLITRLLVLHFSLWRNLLLDIPIILLSMLLTHQCWFINEEMWVWVVDIWVVVRAIWLVLHDDLVRVKESVIVELRWVKTLWFVTRHKMIATTCNGVVMVSLWITRVLLSAMFISFFLYCSLLLLLLLVQMMTLKPIQLLLSWVFIISIARGNLMLITIVRVLMLVLL